MVIMVSTLAQAINECRHITPDELTRDTIRSTKTIEKRLLKYMPKKLIPYIVWLDSETGYRSGTFVYFITIEIKGKEISPDPCDSVSELRFAGKWLLAAVNDINNGADINLYTNG